MATPPVGLKGKFLKTFGFYDAPARVRPVVSEDEVFALLEYSARQGIAKDKINALSVAIHAEEQDHSEIATRYADLAAETQPINGRTLIDSSDRQIRRLFGIGTAAVVFFILAFGNEIADRWMADLVTPEDTPMWWQIKHYAWDLLTPALWGGLGSCVFLLKRVQDLAADLEYEHDRFCGWFTRILIGGILASAVLSVFDPASFTGGQVALSSNALAFLVGVGVKAIYGAIERVIDEFAKKFGLQSVRRQPTAVTTGAKADDA